MKLLTSISSCLLLATLVSSSGCGKSEPPAPVAAVKKDDKAPPPPPIESTTPKKTDEGEPPIEKKLTPLTPEEKKAIVTPKLPIVATKNRPKPTETIALTAAVFTAEIDKSFVDAAKKYESVFVELTGDVRFVGSHEGAAFVTLDGGPGSLGVKCVLAKETEPWAKISKGSKVKVRGEWPELYDQHRLDKCELVEVGPNPALEVSAEALAEEFAKNNDAARKKFQQKPMVIVTGIIVHTEKNEQLAVRLHLKGVGDTKVDCGFDATDRAEAEKQAIGAKVRLVGEFSFFESNAGPALRGCRVISGRN